MNDLPLFSIALPEIGCLSLICVLLVGGLYLPLRYKEGMYWLAQGSLAIVFVIAFLQLDDYPEDIINFYGHYVLDKLAVVTKLFIISVGFFIFAYARQYIKERNIPTMEYYILGLFAILGMLVMASAYSLLTIFLGLELSTLPLYAMVAMRKDSQSAVEASMKYFIMGALASGLLLYGISMVYGATGSIEIEKIGHALLVLNSHEKMLLFIGLAFILAGVIFKFGAVPFHMWVPDVYAGAPTPVTLFISSAPKIAIFTVTMRLLVEAFPSVSIQWQQILVGVSLLSMFGGNLLAIAQTNIKRMLAYSSIAHIGYTLLGILAGPGDAQGYSAALFYIATYVLMAAGAFAIIALLSNENIEFDKIEDFRGLNARHPWLAFMMLLLMFSMAGIPPTVGFFAKLGLLEALVQAHFVWLAALALMAAIIGAYYYLRVVMLMYFEEPRQEVRDIPIQISGSAMTALSVNGLAALMLGLLPSGLIDVCRISLL